MTYNTVIFDLDGTLLDTLDDLTDSVNFAMGSFGFEKKTKNEVKSFVGNGMERLINLCVPEGTKQEKRDDCLDMFIKYYLINMQNKTRPYEGITELLDELKKREVKTAVVSNKRDKAVEGLCKDMLGGYISIVVGESENVKRKPSPDSVLTALSRLNSTKEETLYVGDSDIDIKTAKNAGIKSVGVTWGFRPKALLIKEGADFIIERPSELLELL